MLKIKICGLTRPEDVQAVNRAGPDMAGFVFAPGRRCVSPVQGRQLIRELDPAITPVGVFVDESLLKVAETVAFCGLRAVQLHGIEDAEYIESLRGLIPPDVFIIKALRVRPGEPPHSYQSLPCDLFLLDAWQASAAGGCGIPFEWKLAIGFERPFMIAGGITRRNVLSAAALLNPYGVDVSSGVETDSRKDPAKIIEFVGTVRRNCI